MKKDLQPVFGGGGGGKRERINANAPVPMKCRRKATMEQRVTKTLVAAKIFELEQFGFHQGVEETLLYLGVQVKYT